MASDSKNPKAEAAPKRADAAPKKDATAKATSTAAADTPKQDSPKHDSPKPAGGETSAAAPANYSRGEGQKPVTAAYKENWNAIFAKKRTKKKKR
jgi:hypothetical protein